MVNSVLRKSPGPVMLAPFRCAHTHGKTFLSPCSFRASTPDRLCHLLHAVAADQDLVVSRGKGRDVINAVEQAVESASYTPFDELASAETLVVGPSWLDASRAAGLSGRGWGDDNADVEYTEQSLEPVAGTFEDDGTGFLLWERKASYATNGKDHHETVCGVTFVQMEDSAATIIATFRQPTHEEKRRFFNPDSELILRPGKDNFFYGRTMPQQPRNTPAHPVAMLEAVQKLYSAWGTRESEGQLSAIAAAKLRVHEPMWEEQGAYLPVNSIEAAMWMERQVKNAGGQLTYTPKAVSHVPGTNMVFALWTATGAREAELMGVHVFFFNDDGKIASIASFREPFRRERKLNLLSSSS